MDKYGNDYAITRKDLRGTTPEPTYGGVTSFMRRKYTKDLSGADVAVLGIPFDTATTNRPGTRFGPRAIRNASTIMAWEKPYGMDFDPFDRLAVVDAGDALFDFGRPEGVPDEIEAAAKGIIETGTGLLSFGGDHFVAYPLLKAHAAVHGAPLSLLHFDAHSDTWRDENDRIDHGTMFFLGGAARRRRPRSIGAGRYSYVEPGDAGVSDHRCAGCARAGRRRHDRRSAEGPRRPTRVSHL